MEYFLSFENKGEIDPRLITTMGANVKECESPIGYFGTGLKYAIAVILRNGGRVVVQSGLAEYEFEARKEVMRGKEFSVVWMTQGEKEERMGITLEVGKNWEPWQAYRELYCNMVDEGGEMECTNVYPVPTAGITRVLAFGEAMQQAHYKRNEFILEKGTLAAKVNGLEIFEGSATGVFYLGVRVFKFPAGQRSLYTYNITRSLVLTEDRTAQGYDVSAAVASGVGRLTNVGVIRRVVKASKEWWEKKLDWMWSSVGDEFIAVARQVMKESISELNESLAAKIKALDVGAGRFDKVALTRVEQSQLDRAVAFLHRRNIPVVVGDIGVTESLGKNTLGVMVDDRIWLARASFALGTKVVAGTILEEWVHQRHGHVDCTRALQDFLLNLAIGWGEEIDGTPL